MKIAEEEDLWIGDSGASSHMMGSEEHVFNKKMISGSVRTSNGAHMKMLCEDDINVDVITINGDVTSGTLRVKHIPGMKQKSFSFTQAMLGGWSMQGGQTKQEEHFIALAHEDHRPIIFDRVLKAGNSVLLAAMMVIKNPEEVNAAIVNRKQSKEYFHRVTGHARHHLMDATAKYYKVKDPDYDSEEEVTSETGETDNDESETNNANVNNYLDSANMATNLETAMKIAEEEDLWIGDSGASSHMMGSEEHVFNKKLITGSVETANGAHMKMLCEGDINVDVIIKNGDVTSGTLRVKVIPGMRQKLFSFTQAMMGGWTMQGGQTKQGELFIALTHEDHKTIIFDRVLKAGNSVLLAAKMVIKNPEEVNAAIVNRKQSKEYFHRVTGHAGHHLMDATAKYYKVNLTGNVNNCLSCSLEKIRQKNIPKKNEDKSRNPGERMYLDISSMRKPSMGGRQHWVMLVDEATKYKMSFFLKKKKKQFEPIIDWAKSLKARHEIQVKIIRCDNAGENKVLEKESDKNELGINFEYTAPGTPQQNGVVERAFATVMGRARAMMNHAGFTLKKRQQLWCEAAQTATLLDNILVQDSANSPHFNYFPVDAKYAKHLIVFGEMCVVADTDNKVGRTKIDPRGKISLFVGYSTQHAGDVYRLLNPKTSRVIHSRDVKWIGKTCAEFHKIKMIDRASGYVDPDEDFQLEEEEDQDI